MEDRALSGVGASPITVKADVDEARRSAKSVVRSECVITTNEPRELSAREELAKSPLVAMFDGRERSSATYTCYYDVAHSSSSLLFSKIIPQGSFTLGTRWLRWLRARARAPDMPFNLFKDLVDSLHPGVTGDFGSFFPVLGIAKESKNVTNAFDSGNLPKSARQVDEEKRSLALIELLQKAIKRREQALHQLRDEPGAPASRSFGMGSPISRLALDPYTDAALASEDLGGFRVEGARVDMTDLLPKYALETDGFGPRPDDADIGRVTHDVERVTHETAPVGSTRTKRRPKARDAYPFVSAPLASSTSNTGREPLGRVSRIEDSTTGAFRPSPRGAVTGGTGREPADDESTESFVDTDAETDMFDPDPSTTGAGVGLSTTSTIVSSGGRREQR